MSTTISGNWETSNLDAGPYWALNGTWNIGSLVNGTDFTESVTMDNASSPNNNTTISWNFPNTPATYNVYSAPGVFYGDYGVYAPTNNVTPEQISNIKTLTLTDNLTLSGNTNQYDAIYDMYLTSTPGAPQGATSGTTHEIEVDVHTPSYMQQWINNLPQQHFTDASGMQWTIAENASGNPPMVLFVPSNFQDLTNDTIDLKALLQAAVADGVLSGNEYFNGLGLMNEPQQGSGSMTIHSFSVNYDGDSHNTSGTGATQVASAPTVTTSPTATTSAAVADPSHTVADPAHAATDPAPAATDPTPVVPDPAPAGTAATATNSAPATTNPTPVTVTSSAPATGTGQDTSSHTHHDGATYAHDHALHDATSFAHQHTYEHMWH